MADVKIDSWWLLKMRERNGLSQKQLTRLLGTAPRTVGQWESGRNETLKPWFVRRLRRIDAAFAVERRRDTLPCEWVADTVRERGALPTVLEVADHLDGCATCLSRAVAGVVVPATSLLKG